MNTVCGAPLLCHVSRSAPANIADFLHSVGVTSVRTGWRQVIAAYGDCSQELLQAVSRPITGLSSNRLMNPRLVAQAVCEEVCLSCEPRRKFLWLTKLARSSHGATARWLRVCLIGTKRDSPRSPPFGRRRSGVRLRYNDCEVFQPLCGWHSTCITGSWVWSE